MGLNGNICPSCGQMRLPKVQEGSKITAVMCQNPICGYVYEVVKPVMVQPKIIDGVINV